MNGLILANMALMWVLAQRAGARWEELVEAMRSVSGTQVSQIIQAAEQAADPGAQLYTRQTIDLGTARTAEELPVAGNTIVVEEGTGTLNISVNGKDKELIPIHKYRLLRMPFSSLYLTNTAQTGKSITLLVGQFSDFEIDPVVRVLVQGSDPGSSLTETPIFRKTRLATSASYAEVTSWTVSDGVQGFLSAIALWASDYDHAQFKVTIGDVEQFADQYMGNSLAMPFDCQLAAGTVVKVEAKNDGTAANVDASISGKEVS